MLTMQLGRTSTPCLPTVIPAHRYLVPCLPLAPRHGSTTSLPRRTRPAAAHVHKDVPKDVVAPPMGNHNEEIHYLATLADALAHQASWQDKAFLNSTNHGAHIQALLSTLPASQQAVLLALPAMDQSHVLATTTASSDQLAALATGLLRVEQFYNSIGGLIGYQAKSLQLIADHNDPAATTHAALVSSESSDVALEDLLVPAGVSLHGGADCAIARDATAKGLHALPAMAEIYPLGGAGDRLGLRCETTGESLPTAMLPYCGKTLLEGLLRDLQAREWLYYKLTGRQVVTPVAIMTSDAKGNHERVMALLQDNQWFGRGQDSFRLFRQPMVPVVCVEDGRWIAPEALQPMMKPGGHGAIWKLMLDEGVFDFFHQQGREAAIVRQIRLLHSNPMAGTDNMLLALSGIGHFDGKAFGFASCDRKVGAAEGINVLRHRKVATTLDDGTQGWEYEYGVTCVEYTEFERLGVPDAAENGGRVSRYPANTNILYLGLQAARAAVEAGVRSGGGAALPGMVFNTGKNVSFHDAATGDTVSRRAGRLECTMQNLADCFAQRFGQQLPKQLHGDLDTFVVFNTRRKVTSSAKRRREPGSLRIAQTPDGSFLDLQANAAELLTLCDVEVPEACDVESYLANGPPFIFLHHPALGPVWSLIAQKVQGGRLEAGSELVLEVADAQVSNLQLQGSLIVRAEHVVGAPAGAPSGPLPSDWVPTAKYDAVFDSRMAAPAPVDPDGRVVFGNHNGRVRLVDCTVVNDGIDWAHEDNVYWQHKVARRGAVEILLEGRSEFEAQGVVIRGSHAFRVPNGYKMVVHPGPGGGLMPELIPLGSSPTWEWVYTMLEDGTIKAEVQERTWYSAGQIPLVRLDGEDMGILI